ncbi:endonuclease/exonuclease/phosphatase family protein [Dyadobacter sp. LHD-138]|uniref:endonuclease/exonuclease/phosphatase family protein n=1 Tax=Dyadobacter sp. LHD-138 TaxID=3071413 RepID=UPI0027E19FDD|nr:endonuclease/exonuclease/phosphatase family protein [Dyadobacter sp. LHD-138]MDQ6481590.1 endonuclease/exonuclease/phosphatase family protein [Dyadobacter sp. LHD-138]
MKGLKGFFWLLFKCFGAYSLLVYALTYWVPTPHWVAGFLMMSLPVTVLVSLFFFVFWIFIDPKKSLVPLFLICLGSIFMSRTYQFGSDKRSAEKSGKTFSLLNYNVYGFWITPSHTKKDDVKTNEMKQWLVDQNADILCMPEFNNEEYKRAFQTTEYLKKAGYKYHNFLKNKTMKEGASYQTLAIFSKFPIISHREKPTEQQNGLMYADVLIGKDTVRIIAVHLYSMSLRLSTLVRQKEMAGIKRETKGTFARMKNGFTSRILEVQLLEEWIKESPYPVIVCGDFNETPYSYFYGKTRQLLNNAFEDKGEGFGFTYNKIPWFIRIDNQFYNDKKLTLYDFKTWNNIKYSDHNPSIGTYSVKRE